VTYDVFQGTAPGAENFASPLATTAGLSSFLAPLDPGGTNATTYYFVVRASDACGNSESNNTELSIQPLLNPNGDQDGDGMPNGFEQAYGFDPFNAADANTDADGDGMSNTNEFLAGTDPTNDVSVFRITSVGVTGIDVVVTWSMGQGKTNALQSTAGDLNSSYNTNGFADIFTVTNAVTSTTNCFDIGAATNFPARYYRARVLP
jgi:hypothetical protein